MKMPSLPHSHSERNTALCIAIAAWPDLLRAFQRVIRGNMLFTDVREGLPAVTCVGVIVIGAILARVQLQVLSEEDREAHAFQDPQCSVVEVVHTSAPELPANIRHTMLVTKKKKMVK